MHLISVTSANITMKHILLKAIDALDYIFLACSVLVFVYL